MTAGAVVGASAVTRRYGTVRAVDGVDLRVDPGEVVGLVGANGAGKTTLVRLLLGLVAPSSGAVELFGAPPSAAGRARVGYVPQGLGLYPDLTVAENLAFVASAFGRHTEPHAAPGEPHAAPAVPATALLDTLALGQRRRVAFAAALQHAPDLLVLDEPTSGVDPLGRARLWDTIRAAAETGAGVLVTTHAMSEAEQCDRLAVLARGRVVAAGTPAEIVAGRFTLRIRSSAWAAAFAALDAAGVDAALAGTELRVPVAERGRVTTILRDAEVAAEVSVVPASLDETFVVLAQEGR